MKAKRLVPGQIVNPEYSVDDRIAAREQGRPYDVREFLTMPKGEVIDDPDCWRLCLGSRPQLVPVDDECKQKVLSVMQLPQRKQFFARLRQLSQKSVREQLSRAGREWLDQMLQIYAEEMHESAGVAAAAPASKAAAQN